MSNHKKDLDYGIETAISIDNGATLRCESEDQNPMGTSYVRVVNSEGEEVAYWNSDEWKAEPEFVMGAIMGCIKSGGV